MRLRLRFCGTDVSDGLRRAVSVALQAKAVLSVVDVYDDIAMPREHWPKKTRSLKTRLDRMRSHLGSSWAWREHRCVFLFLFLFRKKNCTWVVRVVPISRKVQCPVTQSKSDSAARGRMLAKLCCASTLTPSVACAVSSVVRCLSADAKLRTLECGRVRDLSRT